MIALKEETKSNLEYLLDLNLKKLDSFDLDEEVSFVANQAKSKISFSKKRDFRKIGRGNPLLARKRIRTMDDVNKRLDKMKYEKGMLIIGF